MDYCGGARGGGTDVGCEMGGVELVDPVNIESAVGMRPGGGCC